MASYFVLSNCVVLFVLFGSVFCGGRGVGSSSNSGAWMKGKKMLNVTLSKPDGESLGGGLVQSKQYGQTWCWEFYDFISWDMGHQITTSGSAAEWFPISGIQAPNRIGNKVEFTFSPPHNPQQSQQYSFTFARERDARSFMGED